MRVNEPCRNCGLPPGRDFDNEPNDCEACMTGTKWTGPGKGATAGELGAALPRFVTAEEFPMRRKAGLRVQSLAHPNGFGAPMSQARTNLRLTGEPLTGEDLARIAAAFVEPEHDDERCPRCDSDPR
jgi:hypothetical protein